MVHIVEKSGSCLTVAIVTIVLVYNNITHRWLSEQLHFL